MTRPTAAPARWPYREHRTLAQIDAATLEIDTMLIDTTNPLMNTLAAIEGRDFDPARFVAAARAKSLKERVERQRRQVYPATSSAPCVHCGASGWNGCDHQGPYEGKERPGKGMGPYSKWDAA